MIKVVLVMLNAYRFIHDKKSELYATIIGVVLFIYNALYLIEHQTTVSAINTLVILFGFALYKIRMKC